MDRQLVARLLVESLGSRPAARLVPYLAMMEPYQRASAVDQLAGSDTTEARRTLFGLLSDPSDRVREHALEGLKRHPSAGKRRRSWRICSVTRPPTFATAWYRLLLTQPDAAVLASAQRLLKASDQLQRLAGLYVLLGLLDEGRAVDACRSCAAQYQAQQPGLPAAEKDVLERLLDRERREPTLDDALGLLDPRQRTRPVPPRLKKPPLARRGDRSLVSEAAVACVHSLDELIHAHRTASFTLVTPTGQQQALLGEVKYSFAFPNPDLPLDQDARRLPLREVWESWWAQRPAALRDPDGLELLRAQVAVRDVSAVGELSAAQPAALAA